jgi:hypothetical protein
MTRVVKRHLQVWTGLSLLSLLVGICYVYLTPRESEPIRAYNRIAPGMTLAEVENAIPPGSHRSTSGMLPPDYDVRAKGLLTPPYSLKGWYWDDYSILVAFGKDDRAIWVHLTEINRPSILIRLYGWLVYW